jgi:glucose-1-phosphate adenylyltransferase
MHGYTVIASIESFEPKKFGLAMKLDATQRYVSRLTHRTLALVMAGGKGARLGALTEWRAKPAVPFGGNFRIIDFTLSNCINSGIRRIGVLTQYKAYSLIRHVQRGWGFLRGEFGEFVELLPPQQWLGDRWYAGTADAVFQNLDIVKRHAPEFVLVLAGDHIYKMDYGPMIARHMENGADLTVGCVVVPAGRASEFGVMSVDSSGHVKAFEEKPVDPVRMPNDPTKALASMGIYVFNRDFLVAELTKDAQDPESEHDFGKNVIPRLIADRRVYAYPFEDAGGEGYWRDVGTVDAFWEANLELAYVVPPLDLYDRDWPIWTYQEQLPPAKFVFDDHDRRGIAVNSLIANGCVISGAAVSRSLLFCNVKVENFSVIDEAVILPDVLIGPGCRIRRVVIDKGCVIREGTTIGEDLEADRARFHVTPAGVTLVTPSMLGQVYSAKAM